MKFIQKHWLTIIIIAVVIVWGGVGILTLFPAWYVSVFFFDAPGSDKNPLIWFMFWSVDSFPVVCILSSLLAFILQFKFKKAALVVTGLPLLSLAVVVAAFMLAGASG